MHHGAVKAEKDCWACVDVGVDLNVVGQVPAGKVVNVDNCARKSASSNAVGVGGWDHFEAMAVLHKCQRFWKL